MTSSEPSTPRTFEFAVPDDVADARLDALLAQQLPLYSRVHLRRMINAARVTVDGVRVKAAHRVRSGEQIRVELVDPPRQLPRPENIPLDILYEDRWLAAINKPPGMVVHPAKGHCSGTLTSALQFHFDHLSGAGGPTRPGIVHRLDRDTSGLLIVAKSEQAHSRLQAALAARAIRRSIFVDWNMHHSSADSRASLSRFAIR